MRFFQFICMMLSTGYARRQFNGMFYTIHANAEKWGLNLDCASNQAALPPGVTLRVEESKPHWGLVTVRTRRLQSALVAEVRHIIAEHERHVELSRRGRVGFALGGHDLELRRGHWLAKLNFSDAYLTYSEVAAAN